MILQYCNCYFTTCNRIWKCLENDRGIYTRGGVSPWGPLNPNPNTCLEALPTLQVGSCCLHPPGGETSFSPLVSPSLFFCGSIIRNAKLRNIVRPQVHKNTLPQGTHAAAPTSVKVSLPVLSASRSKPLVSSFLHFCCHF